MKWSTPILHSKGYWFTKSGDYEVRMFSYGTVGKVLTCIHGRDEYCPVPTSGAFVLMQHTGIIPEDGSEQ